MSIGLCSIEMSKQCDCVTSEVTFLMDDFTITIKNDGRPDKNFDRFISAAIAEHNSGKHYFRKIPNRMSELAPTLLMPGIKKVIFHDPATIVYWDDDTKTVVKCDGEKFDAEKGLAMAISKRAFGNTGNFNEVFKKHIPEELRTKPKKKRSTKAKKTTK